MTNIRDDYLTAARSAADLLRAPAVTAAWQRPSALPEFSVSGLAGHLAYQVLVIARILAEPVPAEPLIPLLEHYGRAGWVGAGLDEEINVRIREGGEAEATGGAEALVARVDTAVEALTGNLATVDDRPVRIPFWGPWSLTLDDMLITRMMELAVHSDDLAVSVGVVTPELPASAIDTVVDLLSRLSVRRHGPVAVLRALSRAERAPASIAAF
jgi:uncharacterized protein (TIGR03083 family)